METMPVEVLPEIEVTLEEDAMNDSFTSRILPRIVASYDDRNQTFSWALLIWILCAVIFAPFSKLEPMMEGATVFSLGWAAIHVLRRL